MERGSAFGGKDCMITNGKSKEVFSMSSYGCFCSIKDISPIPKALLQQENLSFLKRMEEELAPNQVRFPDPSLQWIITANATAKELSTKNPFNLIFKVKPQWGKNPGKMPETYTVPIDIDTLQQFKDFYQPTEWDKQAYSSKGWLTYYGHNHGTLEDVITIDSTALYTAYATKHGVVIKKEKAYAWMFVTDTELTGGPEKLRWNSIEYVRIVDHTLIIQQSLPPDMSSNIFIIDLETGTGGRLKPRFFEDDEMASDRMRNFKIEKQKIVKAEVNGEVVSYKLEDLKLSLDQN